MAESKAAFWRRAEAGGFSKEAKDFREATKKRLMGEGMPNSPEMAREAFRLTVEQFPPGTAGVAGEAPQKASAGQRAAANEIRDRLVTAAEGKTMDTMVDVEWVYLNLGKRLENIDPDTVPSTGAVMLLRAAQADPPWFFATYHTKLLVKPTTDSSTHALRDDGKLVGLVETLIREDGEDHAKMTQELWHAAETQTAP